MSDVSESFWRRCSTCKREIPFDVPYWTCSVSTCNRKGSSFVFCAVDCWQSHVPTMRHREAWAEEQRSPTRGAWTTPSAPRSASGASGGADRVQHPEHAGRRVIVEEAASAARAVGSSPTPDEIPREVLIVASKLKKYVKARSGLNTSESVMGTLSDKVRRLCDDAIERAREEGRKTLMDRDF